MVIVSHQVGLVLRVADRSLMLDRGARGIVAAGSPEELRNGITDPRVRNFIFRGEGSAGKG
jgi:phospholipid/cholesterol/gamma-HCH transport system ATP-binding protein